MFNFFYLDKTDRIIQFLLISLGFFIPLSVFMGNLIMILIFFVFIFTGGINKKNLYSVFNNKVLLFSILFYFAHLSGLLWTENLEWGFKILKKMIDFLIFLPLLWLTMRKENTYFYIISFLIAIFITSSYSLLIYLEILPAFNNGSHLDPTPFMSRISHGPFLAFAFYIEIKLLMSEKLKLNSKLLLATLSTLTAFSLFSSYGRAGYVGFFIATSVLIIQQYGLKIRNLLLVLGLCSVVFFLSYNSIFNFSNRVNETISSIKNYSPMNEAKTSLDERFAFARTTYSIIKDNFFFGVGTGDFPDEYVKYNSKTLWPTLTISQPHNMHLLIFAQLGIFGYVFFLLFFYYLYKESKEVGNFLIKDSGIFLVIYFFIISFSDSYLLGHFTTFLFIYFSSIIIKNRFEEN